jgi:hypothetical protein
MILIDEYYFVLTEISADGKSNLQYLYYIGGGLGTADLITGSVFLIKKKMKKSP